MDITSFSRTNVSLSIENGALRILVVKGGHVLSWMSYPLEPDVFKDGLVLSPAGFQTALSSLFFVRESIRGRISVCFPGNRSFFRTVSLPRFRPNLMTEAMQREAQRELPVNREDVHLLWEPYGPRSDNQDFLLIGMQKDAYARLHTALKANRIKPRIWDLRPLALVRAVSRSNVIIVDLSPGNTEIIVVTGGVPRLVRSLVEPSDLSYQEQGQVLAEHVSRTISYYLANKLEEPWEPKTPVVLTGPLAGNLELVQAFRGACQQPVEPFLCPLPCPPDFTPATYAATLGLAMKVTRRSWIGKTAADFEMLSGSYRPSSLPAKKAAAALALAMAIALLAPAVQVRRGQQTALALRQAELSSLQRELSQTRAGLAEKASLQEKIDGTRALTQTLEQERATIAALGRDISTDISMVLYTVPPEIRVGSYLDMDGVLTVQGKAPDEASILGYARFLEDQGWFTSVAVTDLATAQVGGNSQGSTFILSVSRV